MKHVTLVVPKGKVNISSLAGAFQILSKANAHWQKIGHAPKMEISIAGFIEELQLDGGFFSIHPVNIEDIKQTGLVIIPSVSYDNNLIKENAALINWIRNNIKMVLK